MNKIILISIVIFFAICSRSWALPECEGSPATWEGSEKLPSWNNCKGIFVYGSGNTYKGEWNKDMKHGKGTYTLKDGGILQGIWQNDKFIKDIQEIKEEYKEYKKEYKEQFRVASKACKDLGFEKGTESFGQCILDLTE